MLYTAFDSYILLVTDFSKLIKCKNSLRKLLPPVTQESPLGADFILAAAILIQ